MKRFDAGALAVEAAPGIRLLPVVHDRVESAVVARAALDALDPAAVAIELPPTLAAVAEQAVARLPELSLVISAPAGDDALVWAVVPGDPFVEAIRWARERGRPRLFVDPDLPYGERHVDPVPDPWAIWSVGPERYFASLEQALADAATTTADAAREAGMAHALSDARSRLGGTIVALLGAAHRRGVARRLAGPTAIPLARTHRDEITLANLHPESLSAILPDPPLAHAVWERLRHGGAPPEVTLERAVARPVSLTTHGLRLITRDGGESEHERRLRLVEHAAGRSGRTLDGLTWGPDRQRLGAVVWQVGSRSWEEQTGGNASAWQRRIFLDFARRHARVQGLLVPGLYEWTVAARGVGDDNLGWEVFAAARTYPWQEDRADIPTVRVDGDLLDLGTRKIRFRRRFFRVKQRPVRVPVREHPEPPDDPSEWLEGFSGDGICSYPPEDVRVEEYGRYLQARAVSLLSAERSRSEPFSTGLHDGVDLRETLRRIDDGRVWVREHGRAPGEAGSVVVVFDRDLERNRFPYLMTWLGEHDQESDMAFYATNPAEQVVGPGIMRATYGGFLMTYPPRRLFDVWRDRDYGGAREKGEVLLLAAIDYSEETLVVHVGPVPPSERIRRHAAARAKRIVYLPLGTLSPTVRERLRVLHVLVGHDKRKIAGRYVW